MTRARTSREKVALLRKALQPFARAFQGMPLPVQRSLEKPIAKLLADYGELRVHHLREALEALEETDGEA